MQQYAPDEEWWGSDTFVVRSAEHEILHKVRERVRSNYQLRAQYSKAKSRPRDSHILEIPLVVKPSREGSLDDGEVIHIGDVVSWPEGTAAKILRNELGVATASFTVPEHIWRKKNNKKARGYGNNGIGKGVRSRRHSLMRVCIEQAEAQGSRPTMEDRFVIHLFNDFVAFGVFDGHGGIGAADFVADILISTLRAQFPSSANLNLTESNPQLSDSKEREAVAMMKVALPAAIAAIEARTLEHLRASQDYSGTTLCMCLCSKTTLVVASLGDTRVLVSRAGVVHQVTMQDHQGGNAEERIRIEGMGGHVTPDGYVGGRVQVSRAIGDIDPDTNEKVLGLSATPDLLEFTLDPAKDEFILVGCDGIWEIMSNQYAVSLVRTSLRNSNGDLAKAVDALVEEAISLKTTDNVTAILASLPAVSRIWTKPAESIPDDMDRPRLFGLGSSTNASAGNSLPKPSL